MALTNDQITAQNFKDFYNQIRPYLNGQVPTFANQFSRSDLYSTDEKIVGQWIDGKPLYQKTISCGALPNKTLNTIAHNIANVDLVVYAYGIAINTSNNAMFQLPHLNVTALGNQVSLDADRTNIYIETGVNRTTYNNSYVTLRYTKTTDSAVSVGTGTDYSTTEQIIGTWIDGKPLYQLSLSNSYSYNTNDTLFVPTTTFSTTDKTIRSIDGMFYHEYGDTPHGANNSYFIQGSGGLCYVYKRWQNVGTYKGAVATVRYTKTTD